MLLNDGQGNFVASPVPSQENPTVCEEIPGEWLLMDDSSATCSPLLSVAEVGSLCIRSGLVYYSGTSQTCHGLDTALLAAERPWYC